MENKGFDAYYYSFDPTGCDAVDAILRAVADAGLSFHNTEDWSREKCHDGLTVVEKIQNEANAAAAAWPKCADSALLDHDFETAWAAYPKRPGASRKDSHKAWRARIKAGAKPQEIIDGVHRYAAYVKGSRIEPNFIKQPATFFGPGDHYKSDWTAVAPRLSPAQEQAKQRQAWVDQITGKQDESFVFDN